jgi:hypothetical protein
VFYGGVQHIPIREECKSKREEGRERREERAHQKEEEKRRFNIAFNESVNAFKLIKGNWGLNIKTTRRCINRVNKS